MVSIMRPKPQFTEKLVLRVFRSDICYLKFLFESYEGLASVTTCKPESGMVVLNIAPGCRSEVDTILNELHPDMYMERVERPQTIGNLCPHTNQPGTIQPAGGGIGGKIPD